MTPELLSKRLIEFAVRVGKVADALPETRLGRHIAAQLVRCGTSPPPNYEEACAAESRSDFIHKLSIVLKEIRESRCWLRMIVKADLLPKQRLDPLLDEADQLQKIIGQSVNTAKGSGRETRHKTKEPMKNGQWKMANNPPYPLSHHFSTRSARSVFQRLGAPGRSSWK